MGFEHVIPELATRILAGEDPLVVYSTDHRRAFCYVSDAVDATIRAARAATSGGGTWNVGNDREETTIRDLASLVARTLGRPGLALEPRKNPNDPITRRCPDVSRARQALGYEPRVGLADGLSLTLPWYARQGP
jgi:UDP-glucose 4-epimerase/UDP-glucuronate decarboxylase